MRRALAAMPWTCAIAFSTSALRLGYAAFQWSLVDRFTPFLMYDAERILGSVFLVALLVALTAVRRWRELGRASLLPAAALAATWLAVQLVPFTDLWLRSEFLLRRSARADVAGRVESGELRPNVAHSPSLIALGPGEPLVSRGGNEIVVEEHEGGRYILFFTYRGILDNYAGFLRVPPGGDPARFGDLGETASTQIVPWEPRWYYVSHR